MQVGEPAGAAAVAPLGGEDDEVEGADGLHLAPRVPAPPGLVARADRLHHHALVAGGERILGEARRVVRVGRGDRRHPPRPGDPLEHGEPFRQRRVDEIDAVDVQHVEEERLQPGRRALALGAEAAHRVLEQLRATAGIDAERLAVEHHRRDGQRACRSDNGREPFRDLVEVAGEHAHLVAEAVDLNPRPVELPFDARRAPGIDQRGSHVGRGRGEHRLHGREHLQADGVERVDATLPGQCCRPTEITEEHRRPPHRCRWDVLGVGDGLGDDTLVRSLP